MRLEIAQFRHRDLSRRLARGLATTGGARAAPPAAPDYYAALGLRREASPDDVKAAFRELAKRHHPDALAGAGGAADLALFKLINEAYSVLGNAARRKEYDANTGVAGAAGASGLRASISLRARNEGLYGGVEVARPATPYAAGRGWQPGLRSSSAATAAPATPAADGEEAAFSAADNVEAFRASMARAAERQRDSSRYRASLSRLARTRVSVAEGGSGGLASLLGPSVGAASAASVIAAAFALYVFGAAAR
jgi:curved DNA-binding protein CbpA